MTTCTFDGATVPTYLIEEIQQQGNYSFSCRLRCRTPTYSVYTTLNGKAGTTSQPGVCAIGTVVENGYVSVQSYGGTKGTLVLNGVTYTNCYIQAISAAEASKSNLGLWEFSISFLKETNA